MQHGDCPGHAMSARVKAQQQGGASQLPCRHGHRMMKPPQCVIGPLWSTRQACLAAVIACSQPAAAEVLQHSVEEPFHWTAPTVVLAVALFFIAGLCEIGGGWLVWQVSKPPPATAVPVLGSTTLTIRVLDTAQPLSDAGCEMTQCCELAAQGA